VFDTNTHDGYNFLKQPNKLPIPKTTRGTHHEHLYHHESWAVDDWQRRLLQPLQFVDGLHQPQPDFWLANAQRHAEPERDLLPPA
jgi:hypothetical protein